MSNLNTMRKLVATCPWLGADNLLEVANSNMAYQDAVGRCWAALFADGDVDAVEAAVQMWNDVGVPLQTAFITKVFTDPELNPKK